MDFEAFFNPLTEITYEFNDSIVRHWFLEMDSETDLAYQRMLVQGSRSLLNKNQHLSDNSLTAEIWLYNKLCQKVEIKNGDGFIEVPDFKTKVNPSMKRRAVFDYQKRIAEAAGKDEGGPGNS